MRERSFRCQVPRPAPTPTACPRPVILTVRPSLNTIHQHARQGSEEVELAESKCLFVGPFRSWDKLEREARARGWNVSKVE